MKKICVCVFGMLLAAPIFALADTSPLQPTPLQLETRIAALQAEVNAAQSGENLACAMLFSTSTTSVGQQIILAWGSAGAVDQTHDTLNVRPTNGAATFLFSTPGTWTYSFKFYNATGTSVTCSAKVKVQ